MLSVASSTACRNNKETIIADRLKNWIDRFAGRRAALPLLDVLASGASPNDALENRLTWLVDVVQWIRRPGQGDATQPASSVQVQAGRLRRFFDVLDRNPEWKLAVAGTLRSIFRETSALELFSETGLPRHTGLLAEIGERLTRKILPPPNSTELGILFDRLFNDPGDAAWVGELDETTLQRFKALLEFEVAPGEQGWNALSDELEDALFHLAAQIQVAGCSPAIRARVHQQRVRELPFFNFGGALQTGLAAREKSDAEAFPADLNHLRGLIEASHKTVEEVLKHLENQGVSTEVVYQLEFLKASLDRFEVLLELNFSAELPLTRFTAFVASLIRENRARESVTVLLRQNFHLLTRKILERNGETGEHYIARSPKEYREMLRSAAGGGAIMAFTAWFKLTILGWYLPGLMQGLAASVNYAGGFVAIQLTGSTLATKQPANTAPALAAKMHRIREPKAIEALVNEIVCLIRSQAASIAGNLALVIPVMLALHFLILWMTGAPLMPVAKATKAINAVSILGPSFLYAAFTGVLLWASSMVAAWADNWFVRHRIGEALQTDRRLVRTLGTSRAARFGLFWKRNIAGLAGNISFGFMLGLIPEFAEFAGLPLDIRHVTLSSAMLAAGAASLGPSVIATWPFWLGVIGIAGIALMNLTVSFSLAMFVAIKARGIQSPERRAIYRALVERLRKEPLSFILPMNTAMVIAPLTAAHKNL